MTSALEWGMIHLRDLLMTKTKMTSVITPPKKLIASVLDTTPLITKLKLSLQ
jgi:hypothetical protein